MKNAETNPNDDTSEEDHPTVSASANATKSFWLNDDLTWSLTLDGSADVTASSMATPPKGSIAPHGHYKLIAKILRRNEDGNGWVEWLYSIDTVIDLEHAQWLVEYRGELNESCSISFSTKTGPYGDEDWQVVAESSVSNEAPNSITNLRPRPRPENDPPPSKTEYASVYVSM